MRPFLTLHHPAQSRRYYEQGVWRGDTFYGLLAGHAAVRPDAIALQDGRRRVTWKELHAWVDGVAADLRARADRVVRDYDVFQDEARAAGSDAAYGGYVLRS